MDGKIKHCKSGLAFKTTLSLGVGVSAMLFGFAATASAQDADGETDSRRLQAVTVEATRREGVTVQDVPVAVTAFDSAMLEDTGFKTAGDLEQIAPSVQITQTESAASGTSISIRGLGTGSNNPGFEPAVGVLIDGVFRTRTGVALAELPELSSVELLRGPQGTLFGRNTSAGVISINTKKPTQESDKYVGLTIGNFNAFTAEFGSSGAISDNWSARFDAKMRERNGYITDANTNRSFNDIERFSVRGQLLYEGDNSDLRIIADYAETDENCCAAVNFSVGPTAAAVNAAAGSIGLTGILQGDPADRRGAFSPNRGYPEAIDEWGVSAQWDKSFGDLDFTSITAYRDWQAFRDQDIDFSGIDRALRDGNIIEDKVFTQEFRLQGQNGALDWLVGGFFMNEDLFLHETIQFGTQGSFYTDALFQGATAANPALNPLFPNGLSIYGTFDPSGTVIPSFLALANPALFNSFAPSPNGQGALDDFNVETNAIAIFTHNEISLGEALTATVGVRYNYEQKDINVNLTGDVAGCDFLATNPAANALIPTLGGIALLMCNPAVDSTLNGTYSGDRSDNEFTGTAKLAYEFSADAMGYASYSRGFKSGGYNLARSGFDSTIFGGNGAQVSDLEFDAEIVDAFEVGVKTSWMDGLVTVNGAIFFQDITDLQVNVFSGTNFRTFNVDSMAQGVEIDFGASPVEGLIIQGGYAYTIAEGTEDITIVNGGVPTILPLDGLQQQNTPEHVLTGSGTYTAPLRAGLDGFIHGNFRYNSEASLSILPGQNGVTDNDSYTTFGARVGMRSDNGWEISIFGENLTDPDYNLASFAVPEQTGTLAVYPSPPRFYGIEAKVHF